MRSLTIELCTIVIYSLSPLMLVDVFLVETSMFQDEIFINLCSTHLQHFSTANLLKEKLKRTNRVIINSRKGICGKKFVIGKRSQPMLKITLFSRHNAIKNLVNLKVYAPILVDRIKGKYPWTNYSIIVHFFKTKFSMWFA